MLLLTTRLVALHSVVIEFCTLLQLCELEHDAFSSGIFAVNIS